MESKVNYTLVGLFVIVLGAALLAVVVWLAAAASGNQVYDLYRVYFRESVAGLNLNASVKYRGVNVGQVTSIRLDRDNPDRVELLLKIERSTPIHEDTVAKLVVQGLTGLVYVDLSGRGQLPPLKAIPGEPPPVIRSGPSLVRQVEDAFQDLTVKLDKLLSDENQAALSQTLTNLGTISGAIADRTDTIKRTLDNLEKLSASLAASADNLSKALDGAAGMLTDGAASVAELKPLLARISNTFSAAETMVKRVTAASAAVQNVADEGLDGLQQFVRNTTPEVGVLLASLDRLAASLERFVQALDRNPRMLLFGKPTSAPGPGE